MKLSNLIRSPPSGDCNEWYDVGHKTKMVEHKDGDWIEDMLCDGNDNDFVDHLGCTKTQHPSPSSNSSIWRQDITWLTHVLQSGWNH